MWSAVKSYDAEVISIFRPVPMFLHQTQVRLVFRGSDYPFSVFSAFFNLLWRSVEEGRLHMRLKGKVRLSEWEKGGNKVNGRDAYVLFNRRLGIVMYRYSLQKDHPVMINFVGDVGFNQGMAKLPEKNTLTIQKNFNATEPTVWFNFNFVGHPSRYKEFLEKIKGLPHMEIDYSVAEVRPIRSEVYVRYDERKEIAAVKRMLEAVYRRYGLWSNFRRDRHEGQEEEDVLYNGRVGLFFDGIKLHIKSYRRENYVYPAKSFDDHPKIEVSVYYDNLSIEEVDYPLEKAKEFLASFVYVAGLEDDLILGFDTYPMTEAYPSPIVVRGMLKGDLEELIKRKVEVERLKVSKLEWDILARLSYSNLDSDRLKEFANTVGVPIRTVRYHMKKLENMGFVLKRRVKRNKWVYMLNTERLRETVTPKVEPRVNLEKLLEKVREREEIPEELLGNSRLLTVYVLLLEGYNTTKALSKVLSVSDRQVRNYLSSLKSLGLVEVLKRGKLYVYRPLGLRKR